MKTILDFQARKAACKKISMITCYDACFAKLLAQTDIDCILVGDSAAMVMHGLPSTVEATLEMMAFHTAMVARGLQGAKFIIGDMPFLSYHKDQACTMEAVQALMQSGAHAVKLEGGIEVAQTVQHITTSGVPVMGHIGLTPQSMHQLGGFKVQGKTQSAAQKLLDDAKALEAAGCFAVVLECVPEAVAKTITAALTIPTIGIGAGADTDGQVLVLQDMLGMNTGFKPKFLKHYLNGAELVQQSVNAFCQDIEAKTFPEACHVFSS